MAVHGVSSFDDIFARAVVRGRELAALDDTPRNAALRETSDKERENVMHDPIKRCDHALAEYNAAKRELMQARRAVNDDFKARNSGRLCVLVLLKTAGNDVSVQRAARAAGFYRGQGEGHELKEAPRQWVAILSKLEKVCTHATQAHTCLYGLRSRAAA